MNWQVTNNPLHHGSMEAPCTFTKHLSVDLWHKHTPHRGLKSCCTDVKICHTQIMVFLQGLFVSGIRWNSEKLNSIWLQKHLLVCLSRFVSWCKLNQLFWAKICFRLDQDRCLSLLLFGLVWDKNKAKGHVKLKDWPNLSHRAVIQSVAQRLIA